VGNSDTESNALLPVAAATADVVLMASTVGPKPTGAFAKGIFGGIVGVGFAPDSHAAGTEDTLAIVATPLAALDRGTDAFEADLRELDAILAEEVSSVTLAADDFVAAIRELDLALA